MKVGGYKSFFLNSKDNRKPLPEAVIKALMPTEKEMPKVEKKEKPKAEKKKEEPKKAEPKKEAAPAEKAEAPKAVAPKAEAPKAPAPAPDPPPKAAAPPPAPAPKAAASIEEDADNLEEPEPPPSKPAGNEGVLPPNKDDFVLQAVFGIWCRIDCVLIQFLDPNLGSRFNNISGNSQKSCKQPIKIWWYILNSVKSL